MFAPVALCPSPKLHEVEAIGDHTSSGVTDSETGSPVVPEVGIDTPRNCGPAAS